MDGGGGQGLPPLKSSLRVFSESLLIPTDASGAYRPNPQANNEASPPSLNGYTVKFDGFVKSPSAALRFNPAPLDNDPALGIRG